MAGGDSTAVKNLLNSAQSGRILSKDMDQYVKACYNGDMPACRTVCPLGLNVVQFVSKLQKGNFNSAYGQYREKAIFPAIACRLCDQPCLEACVRKSLDNSIDIRKLERAAVDFTRTTIPEKYSIPEKAGRIAVIGAGLCGLSCTYKLASHGYAVTVYEKDVMTGGRLWDLLEPEDFRDELEVQLQQLEYGLNLETEISCIDDLKSEYNAILVATGLDGEAFGLLEEMNRDSLGSAVDGIFLAGSLLGANPIQSIENGIRAARSIESWLQTGRMHVIQGAEISKASRLQVNLKNLKCAEGVKAERYSREEAATEASRCLKCDCRECMEVCDLMKYYDKLPARIVNDVRVSLNAVDQLTQKVATRLISSCNDCGLCGAVCSENIDMGDFLLDARRIMHREGTMPPVFHDFWMRDMKHAEGEDAYIAKNAPGHGSSDYLFFPGCQLGASDPAYVESTYEYLLDKYPGTGILVGCCGAPAEWAGDEPRALSLTDRLRSQWEVMGRPIVLMACPACEKMFSKYLPEIKSKSIYEYIAEKGLPGKRQVDK
ncbi:MAG: NAD(P)-binding protein, partial [Clostridiales bacterium]|nr:NAD(P)-binding protein [Clostridiales bacterium]